MPSPIELETPATWANAIEKHCKALRASGLRSESIRLRRNWLRTLSRDFPQGFTLSIEQLLEWSGEHEWSQSTRRSVHSNVNAFYQWLYSTERIKILIELPRIPKVEAVARPADDRALEVALERAEPLTRLMVRQASELGLRRAEVAQGHSRDIIQDLLGCSLIVHGKGGKTRVIPMSDSLARALLDLPEGFFYPGQNNGHLSPAWVGRLVARALPNGVTMHMLRHRFATRAYAATGDILSVQRLLGHASPETTIRYIQLGDERLRAAVLAAA